MKRFFPAAFVLIGTLPLLSIDTTTIKNQNTADKGFAVVELFTSEGCSSCPPADAAVMQLTSDFPNNVYVISYHVDYWNNGGWRDEFSSADYTKRQDRYAEQFGLNSIYTPQVVVNGGSQFVGSNVNQLQSAVKKSLGGKASVPIKLIVSKDDNKIKVNYSAEAASENLCILNIALIQLTATTEVKRGENGGRTLHHINIVRDLKASKATYDGINGSASFSVPKGLTSKDIEVVAFLQDFSTLEIKGVTRATID
jgi:hypothetical protein